MLDTFQWLILVLPFVLTASMGLWPKRFERPLYRWAVVIFCVLFSAGAYIENKHEGRKAAAAIKETAVQTSARVTADLTKQYADTVAAQAQKIGELEGFIQSQGKDVREVKKYTVAIWQHTDTGEQKRKSAIQYINERILQAGSILKYSSSVGPHGSGGSPPEQFLEMANRWTTVVQSYLLGSLGQSYADRFNQAGYPGHIASTPRTSLDSKSASQIELQVRLLEAGQDTLKEFVDELAKLNSRKF
jgi:hypothetical protein